ncbi:nucleotidyltransferase domain-containing protein [Candidatus Pacearchaeota archaeon]|nr:nucleotidyltransferase domain-containing protein [Candidatus Pacearchaeota archaeon]
MKLFAKHLNFLGKLFSPEKVILFGSRARGEHLEDSDIDVIVVSKKFNGINFRERIIEAYGMWDKKQGLDIICYTPEEFEKKKKQIGIVQEAVKEGIEL